MATPMNPPNVIAGKVLGKGCQPTLPIGQQQQLLLHGRCAFGQAILCRDAVSGAKMVKKEIKCANIREVQDAKMEAKYLDDLKSTNVIGYHQ
eukprot:gene24723-18373_t